MAHPPGHNEPAASLNLTQGEVETLEIFLRRARRVAEQDFHTAQAHMLTAASDVELCTQMLMKLKGEPTTGRHVFQSAAEQLARLTAKVEE